MTLLAHLHLLSDDDLEALYKLVMEHYERSHQATVAVCTERMRRKMNQLFPLPPTEDSL